MTGNETARADAPDEAHYDVVIVGGGPTGSAAAIFTARYGLDTVVFDRGSGALDRCAFLENYPGFPGGIDVETFQALLAEHLATAGADRIADMVVDVDPTGEGTPAAPANPTATATDDDTRTAGSSASETTDADGRFVVATQDGRTVTADYVVAAAWYDGSYLRGIDDDAMFTEREHHGELEERFDREYPDHDGRTDVPGLYVASPDEPRSEQAIVAAGNGAAVARCLLEDHRKALGYPPGVTPVWDWRRRDDELSGEWADRDRWREWFHNRIDDEYLDDEADLDDASLEDDAAGDAAGQDAGEGEHGPDRPLATDRLVEIREAVIDAAFATTLSESEAESQAEAGLEQFVDVVGQERVLDAVDDDVIRSRASDLEPPTPDAGGT